MSADLQALRDALSGKELLTAAQRRALLAVVEEIALGVRVVARMSARHEHEPRAIVVAESDRWAAVVTTYSRLLASVSASVTSPVDGATHGVLAAPGGAGTPIPGP